MTGNSPTDGRPVDACDNSPSGNRRQVMPCLLECELLNLEVCLALGGMAI